VVTGPVEATALGNLLTQVRARGELSSLGDMRQVIRASSNVHCYEPKPSGAWGEAAGRLAIVRREEKLE